MAAAAVGEFRQIEFKRQQFKQENLQDKSLQDLRAFALEYVKQIVARASELSQQASRQQQIERPPGSLAAIASRINREFQLPEQYLGAPEVATNPKRVLVEQSQRVCAQPAAASQTAGRENLLRRIEDDYDDDDEERFAKRLATGSGSGGAPAGPKGSQRRKLYQWLNWHLFVSCFANCLPHTLVETAGSGGARGAERPSKSNSGPGTAV